MNDVAMNDLERIRGMFNKANFVNDLGIELVRAESGLCETRLKVQPRHLQQTQVVHAGVLATIADHTAGGAASTVLREGQYVLSVEFKINLLRPAAGNTLRCVSRVLKAGKSLVIAESEVFTISDSQETLASKATVTLAVIHP